MIPALRIACFSMSLALCGAPASAAAEDAPALRPIPGITAEDPFPRGCVDCHVERPDLKMDVRLSTIMRPWQTQVDPAFLARVQPYAPSGVMLKGKHEPFDDTKEDIPTACITCHDKKPKTAPPFARLVHGLHLVGGEKNHFLTKFEGQCTYCHKLDTVTGAWSVGHGSERR